MVIESFCLSYCLWGSQGKNTEVVCHCLLQWTMFCIESVFWEKINKLTRQCEKQECTEKKLFKMQLQKKDAVATKAPAYPSKFLEMEWPSRVVLDLDKGTMLLLIPLLPSYQSVIGWKVFSGGRQEKRQPWAKKLTSAIGNSRRVTQLI